MLGHLLIYAVSFM
ncbi:Granule-bound starch synthase 1 chloroplastic/amyloplastic [Zea mays]|nr:Granule-bound starch synthase 1, chloroplastic/amyloplastic [Zea mays]AQL02310.1 Granule-bound starch synthase 1, chloroplastic/amyloplastic [Zea mays]AQL02314.1 Granule-bound starch synthase 1, chloroplastic/amyloplastic [Zea mays]AQL02321.1 Granule-bound starch synthase 1, chloroplastic/amyloplastic [Zea mays]AQL02323.1 Granule-bound starch synthase 1, chloroplastic/amyloplastic [Zea mays]